MKQMPNGVSRLLHGDVPWLFGDRPMLSGDRPGSGDRADTGMQVRAILSARRL
jgi:hypothetical protein